MGRADEAEREALTAQAKAELFASGPLVARHYERNPEGLHQALRPILMRVISAACASSQTQTPSAVGLSPEA